MLNFGVQFFQVIASSFILLRTMMHRQSSLIRTLAVMPLNGSTFLKFNANAFAKNCSSNFARGFADQAAKSGEKLRAVVFQPEVQQKQRKKQDIFAEAGKFRRLCLGNLTFLIVPDIASCRF